MIDERDLFERSAAQFDPPVDAFDRFTDRRGRHERNRRLAAAVVAVVIAVAGIGLALRAVSSTTPTPGAPILVVPPQGWSPPGRFGPDGDLYWTDCRNARVQRVTPSGGATSVVGAGAGGFSNGFSGDGGPATEAHLGCPTGIAFDSAGRLFVVDHLNDRVRVVGTDGIITTIAGNGVPGSDLGDGGPATAASLFHPNYLAFAPDGSLYVTDRDNQRIRRIDLDGNITTVAGTGDVGFSGDGGPATEAELDLPGSLFIDPDGTVYFSDGGNNRIRKIDTDGVITTVAGTGKAGYSGDGGLATQAQLAGPQGVVVDADGNLYIADYDNNVIRRVDTHGVITTVAGNGHVSGRLHYSGPALRGHIRAPEVLTIGPHGRLFITEDDFLEPRLLVYDPTDRTLSTVAVLPVT